MEQFKEEYKEEKGFECWTEGSNYGSYTDDYVNWLEQKLAINYTPCCKSDSELLIGLLTKLENGGGNNFIDKKQIVDDYLEDN